MADAIACFDTTLDGRDDAADPDVTLARFYRAEAHGRLGREALAADDARLALEHFDAAIADHPAYADLHLQRALCLLEIEDALAAERAARRALELNEEFVEAGVVLAVSLHEQGQSTRAREVADEWKTTASKKGSAHEPLLTDLSTALRGLRAIRSSRQSQRKEAERVESLLHDGVWSKAEEILERLLSETPDYPDLRLRMAACRAAQHDLDGALSHLEVALERNPEFRDGLILAGIVELRRSRLVKARRHFDRARALGSLSSPVLYGSAICSLRTGQLENAREQLEEVWSSERPGVEARSLRAALAALTGDLRHARESYDEIVRSSDALHARVDAASFGLQVDDLDLARRALEDLPPGPPDAAVVLARAEILRREGDPERAIDVLEAATADDPDHPGILWLLARVHADCRHREVALRRLANLEALGYAVSGATALSGRLMREEGDPDGSLQRLSEPDGEEPTADIALETLYTVRTLGDAEQGKRLWLRWVPLTGLDLRWRIQDPDRWLGPIPVWPTRVHEAVSD